MSLTIPEHLTRKFDPAVLKFNANKVYVPIEQFLERLNEVDWCSKATCDHFALHPEKAGQDKDKLQWLAAYTVHLTIGADTRAGTGSNVNFDPDTAVKAALAEGTKKAANQFGIGAYLLGKNNRERDIHVEHHYALVNNDLDRMKAALRLAADVDGLEWETPGELANHYKLLEKELQDFNKLDAALRSRF